MLLPARTYTRSLHDNNEYQVPVRRLEATSRAAERGAQRANAYSAFAVGRSMQSRVFPLTSEQLNKGPVSTSQAQSIVLSSSAVRSIVLHHYGAAFRVFARDFLKQHMLDHTILSHSYLKTYVSTPFARWPSKMPTPPNQWQRRYYRCVKKFGQGYVKGDARTEKRDQCLERFDDFQKCVLVRDRAWTSRFASFSRPFQGRAYRRMLCFFTAMGAALYLWP